MVKLVVANDTYLTLGTFSSTNELSGFLEYQQPGRRNSTVIDVPVPAQIS